jgi:hypothetical protein
MSVSPSSMLTCPLNRGNSSTADVEAKAQVMELLDDCLTELNRQDPVPGTCQQYR